MKYQSLASRCKLLGKKMQTRFRLFLKARSSQLEAGFTLIEMLVSLALFAIVVLVAVGALLSLVGADKKAQALESVMNNLNITIDDMVRNARQGTVYHCGSGAVTTPQDCSSGGTIFGFEPYGGNVHNADQWVFQFIPPSGSTPGYIEKSSNGGATWSVVTAPEVSITSMTFYVVGSTPSDTLQPKVVIVIEGTAGGSQGVKVQTTFHIQATAVQRVLDL